MNAGDTDGDIVVANGVEVVDGLVIPRSRQQTATAPQPALPTPAPRYSNDDSADQLNSSRLPPGYHCHMLKFGERICHGGLD